MEREGIDFGPFVLQANIARYFSGSTGWPVKLAGSLPFEPIRVVRTVAKWGVRRYNCHPFQVMNQAKGCRSGTYRNCFFGR